jgi:hypothetical protein
MLTLNLFNNLEITAGNNIIRTFRCLPDPMLISSLNSPFALILYNGDSLLVFSVVNVPVATKLI